MLYFIKTNWADLISWSLAMISILFAIYEYKKNLNLKKSIRFNNWLFFQRTNNLGGTIQKCLSKLQQMDIDKEIFESIVRSDTLSGELIKENIRLIYTFEPSFKKKDIDKWVREGKISGGYDDIFKKYMIDK